jgi:hypothetical protein
VAVHEHRDYQLRQALPLMLAASGLAVASHKVTSDHETFRGSTEIYHGQVSVFNGSGWSKP